MDCEMLYYLGVRGNKSPGVVGIFIRGREDCNQRKMELKLHFVHSP